MADALPSPRLARKASSIPPSLTPVLKSLGLEEEDPEDVFEIHSKEGAGAFGRVFRATYRREPTKVAALKVIPVALEAGQRGEDIENVRREIQFLRECDHPNVVAFFGAYYKDSALWVAMEYCGGGSVGDVSRRRRLDEDEIAVIMRGALHGLAYLHARKKIHRDIKGGNILLTSDGLVKIADFGVSAQLKDTMSRRGTFVGTPYWMSPEMIQDSDYDYKSDIWSLGITMIELADQKPPLFDEHPMRVLIQIPRNPPPSVQQPHLWTPLFAEFLQFCLRKDPNERPSAVECLDHAFIQRVAGVVGVYAEGMKARRVIAAEAADRHPMLDNDLEGNADTAHSVLTTKSAAESASRKEDSEAMADDVTLKASAARPPRSAMQPSVAKPSATPEEASIAQRASPLKDLQPMKDEAADSQVGTPRDSESMVEDVWDQSPSAAISSSRSSRSDCDDDDEVDTAEDTNASAEGFAFRQFPAAAAVAVRTEANDRAADVVRDEMLTRSVDNDSFEIPASALISKIHAAANTLAGQSVRPPTFATKASASSASSASSAFSALSAAVPVPLQAASSPNLRGNKKTSAVGTTRFQPADVAAPPVTGPPPRDLRSVSKFDAIHRSSPPHDGAAKRSHDDASDSSNPLAGLVPPSYDRVNSLLCSISASSSRLMLPLPPADMALSMECTHRPASLRGSAMGFVSGFSASSQFIGAPFRVSHALCVKYNTHEAKFEGAPTSSEWTTIHRQFGIALAQMRCRSNAHDHVPALLHMLRRELVQRDGLDCKYIYRVSPEQSAVLHAKQAINGGVFDAASVSDPHVFASLIKHWLRELPMPLLAAITRQDLGCVVQSLVKQEHEDGSAVPASLLVFSRPFKEVHSYLTATVLDKLPVAERGVVLWLVDHMIEVVTKSNRNGMTAQSLAVVMAPNVYRWASATPADASVISKQVATLLRVLVAWRQQCHSSSSSVSTMEDAGRSGTLTSRVGGRGSAATTSDALAGAAVSTTTIRDSLNSLRESLNASMARDSTVASLLRRSSVGMGEGMQSTRPPQHTATHFISAAPAPEAPGQQSSFTQQHSSRLRPLDAVLRELVDSLWNDLPRSLLLHDKPPPIVRSLHAKFQRDVLTGITQYSKHDHERRWAAQWWDRLSKHECSIEYEKETHVVPVGLRRFARWLEAAQRLEAFVKLLAHERHVKERLEIHWPHSAGLSKDAVQRQRLTPKQAFSVNHILRLGTLERLQANVHQEDEEDGTTKQAVDGVLMDGAATFVKVLHGRAVGGRKAQPLAEEIARLGEQEPAIGQLLTTMSRGHMHRFHLDKQHAQVAAVVGALSVSAARE